MTKDEAVEKVKKLERLSAGAGTPEEARAAGVRAAQLRAKYAISDYDLRDKDVPSIAADTDDLVGMIFQVAEKIAGEKYNPYDDPTASKILDFARKLGRFQRTGQQRTVGGR